MACWTVRVGRPDQARQLVLGLGHLDLKLPFSGLGALLEDIEDQVCPVAKPVSSREGTGIRLL